MEWNDLNAFISVAEAGSFTQAAHKLGLTQPAVSKRVKSLEAHLSTHLFDRVGRRVFVTDAGRLLLTRAKNIMADVLDTEVRIRNLQTSVDGELRLSTSHHVGLHHLAPALKIFVETHPQVKLNIRFEDSENAHALVQQAHSELAVVTLDPQGPGELEYLPLWDDPLVFVHSALTPLPVEQQTLAQLTKLPSILPGLDTYTGRIVAQQFLRSNIDLVPTLSTNYLETIRMLVVTGLGWSVLPKAMVDASLQILDLPQPPARTLGCVINPKRALSNVAVAFMELLTTGFSD